MVINSENAQEVESGEGLGDIQWLRAKYKLVLEREQNMLEYLTKILGDFDYRIKVIEEKLERG